MSNQKRKRKKNFIIYSLNGGMFSADTAMDKDQGITEEDILTEVFKKETIDEIVFSKITEDEEFKKAQGIDEDIRVYFSSSQDEVWNYNPIMSAYMGSLVYSSILVFVSENELEENFGNPIMEFDKFQSIVSGFIQTCTQFLYENMSNTEETKNESNQPKQSDKSPMFQLSRISFRTNAFDEEDHNEVRPGKNKQRLDEFWTKNYVGKYHPDFVFNDLLSIDEDTGAYSKTYLMMKPGMMTLYQMDPGKAEIYFTQYGSEMFTKVVDEMSELIEDLGKDPSEEDIKKEKEKAMAVMYS